LKVREIFDPFKELCKDEPKQSTHWCLTRFQMEVGPDFRILCYKHHPKGRYSASAIERDHHSMIVLRIIDRLFDWAVWFCVLPFRLSWRALRWATGRATGRKRG